MRLREELNLKLTELEEKIMTVFANGDMKVRLDKIDNR
jgi:hypothetical protein